MFDVVVVGAGIQGAALAREAALRGLDVLLLDARDVAAGTSSRSSRLVHGGLRYLQHGHVALVREALQERERLLRLAPHLVRPLPMLLPFFRDSGVGRLRMRFGTWLYSQLARGSTLPRPRGLSADAAARAFPGLRRDGLRSALEFFDARTDDLRLTLANVLAAAAAGCAVLTHAEVLGVAGDELRVRDRVGDVELRLRARHVLNAAGPRLDDLRRRLGVDAGGDDLVRHSRGSHVVLAPRPGELALAAFLPDRRIQFVIPHAGGTLCGTTEVDDPLPGDETGPPAVDFDYLLGALAHLLDPAPTRADARFAYAGWRALPHRQGPAGALNREAFVVDERWAGGTLHSVVGGKLTTHRALAERTVARLFAVDAAASATRHQPLPGGAGPREVDDPLWWRHGSRVTLLRQLVADDPTLATPLCPHRPFVAAELALALEQEGAVTFADALLRRLVHPLGPCLQGACLRAAHQRFLRHRRWPVDDAVDRAIAALRAEVAVLTGELDAWRDNAVAAGHGGGERT